MIYAILIDIRLDELPRGDKKKARGGGANASRPKCAPDGVLQLTQYNEESSGKQIYALNKLKRSVQYNKQNFIAKWQPITNI